MEEKSTKEPLKRSLGLFNITMIGLGAMIGAGIFVLIGDAAGEAGPAVTLAFFLNGIIALIVGSAYAELAAAVPRAGGAYEWVKLALRPSLGFTTGWISWFGHAVACSLYALGFASFVAELAAEWNVLPALPVGRDTLETGLAVAVIVTFVLINIRGASETGLVQNVVTLIQLLTMVSLIGFGTSVILEQARPLQSYRPFLPQGFLGVGLAMGLTFIAFEGYEIIAQSGEETKKPGRNLPRAIFASIVVATTIYILVSVVLIGGVTPEGQAPIYEYLGRLREMGLVEAAGQLMPYGRVVLLIAGIASTVSALNATIYSASRVAFAMGREGQLPRWLARVRAESQTPFVAIMVSGTIILVMALTLPLQDVAASADIMFLMLFVLVNYTLISLRRDRPEMERPFKMPFYPLLPWVGIAAGVALALTLYDLSPTAWLSALIWFALGATVYVGYSRRQRADA